MRREIYLLICYCICIACSKPVTPAPVFSAQIFYKNQTGADLLNPQTSGAFSKDAVQVHDLVNANGTQVLKTSIFDTSDCNSFVCQCRTGSCEESHIGEYHIQYYFHPLPSNLGTVIQVSPSVVDTLNYKIIAGTSNSGYLVDEVTYKGQVVWSAKTNSTHSITIVK